MPTARCSKLPFKATLGETWRFHAEALPTTWTSPGPLGRHVHRRNGVGRPASPNSISDLTRSRAPCSTPAGDQRYLAGEVRDEELQLVALRRRGRRAVRREARTSRARSSANAGPTAAARGASSRAATPTPSSTRGARLAPAQSRGAVPVRVHGSRRPGRVVQTIRASQGKVAARHARRAAGVPNSHDEARCSVQLAAQYRSRGLEIVALMFEQHAEFEPCGRGREAFPRRRGHHLSDADRGQWPTRRRRRRRLSQLDAVLAVSDGDLRRPRRSRAQDPPGFIGPGHRRAARTAGARNRGPGSKRCCRAGARPAAAAQSLKFVNCSGRS